MLSSLWVVSALCAVTLSAPAPTFSYSAKAAEKPAEMQILADYFQLLAAKVQAGRNMAQAPVCDLSLAQLPAAAPTPLPAPATGLTLKHVAIGRGTQNYTCGANATAAPAAFGAVATLYNASCIAASYPDLLATLPNLALQFTLKDTAQATLTPSNLLISGHHYFLPGLIPFFDLDTTETKLGSIPCAKNGSAPAPADAPKGQGSSGLGAVPWLKLIAKDGATGNLQEVYRINTAGGSAPATCDGITDTAFQVEYAAEYWFYQKP